MPPKALVPVPGTQHRHRAEPGLRRAPIIPSATLRATVLLRSRQTDDRLAEAVAAGIMHLPHHRHYLSDAQCARQFGARRDDVQRVCAYARSQGLSITARRPEQLSVTLAGSLEVFSRAFGVRFARYVSNEGECVSYDGPVHVPRHLASVVQGMLGFDTRALTDRHTATRPSARPRYADPAEVARAYRFPEGTDGRGQTIGLIELGGGFRRADLSRFFKARRLKVPRIVIVPIDGGTNAPADSATLDRALKHAGLAHARQVLFAHDRTASIPPTANAIRTVRWTLETTADLELIGAFAPKARIVLYLAPDTLQGQYHAFAAAITDAVHRPSVISCSWGREEDQVPPAFAAAVDRLLQMAALKGITVCCSSGDNGEALGPAGPQVQFPASSPHVLSCGGTSMHSVAAEERAWEERLKGRRMASGGGYSTLFPRPAWQHIVTADQASAGRRAIPDVAGKADLATGYAAVVGNIDVPMGGTSAAAPMWASLVARLNQKLRNRTGFLNGLLYAPRFKNATRDVIRGKTSRRFFARPGWNPCTGLGSPNGERLLIALEKDRPRP